MNDTKVFKFVIRDGLLGAIIGLFAGLVLSIVIYSVLVFAEKMIGNSHVDGDLSNVVLMLGMGWGAVLGGIFGGITALKK